MFHTYPKNKFSLIQFRLPVWLIFKDIGSMISYNFRSYFSNSLKVLKVSSVPLPSLNQIMLKSEFPEYKVLSLFPRVENGQRSIIEIVGWPEGQFSLHSACWLTSCHWRSMEPATDISISVIYFCLFMKEMGKERSLNESFGEELKGKKNLRFCSER